MSTIVGSKRSLVSESYSVCNIAIGPVFHRGVEKRVNYPRNSAPDAGFSGMHSAWCIFAHSATVQLVNMEKPKGACILGAERRMAACRRRGLGFPRPPVFGARNSQVNISPALVFHHDVEKRVEFSRKAAPYAGFSGLH
jgi:hypothetical protein